MNVVIEPLPPDAIGSHRAELAALLQDAVDGGASVGFLPPVSGLYRSLGWQFAGAIPGYARSAGGALDATAIYYKLLSPPDPAVLSPRAPRSSPPSA